MNDKEFNLIDESWIRVINDECRVDEISLAELFKNAHKYKDLCGEIPTQDFALFRFLLAILHTVISRFDINGEPLPLKDNEDALDRWEEFWHAGRFPDEVISDYLESYRESFYLFHPERPFYQCEHAKVGTEYSTAKLYGDLSESNNKVRMFSMLSGKEKNSMTFSEAARWLMYLNAFDGCVKATSEFRAALKALDKKPPSISTGWLGQLGLICVLGNNLFETLMLNLVLMYQEKDGVYPKEKPIWEFEKIPDGECVKIVCPDNLAQLYTLQSRRLYLKKENKKVIGFYGLGGNFFDKENDFIEPMTVWRAPKKDSNIRLPNKHDASRQFWRDFSALIISNDQNSRPGIIEWIELLEDIDILENPILDFKIASVQYDSNNYSVTNIFSDSFQFHSSLISEMNSMWQNMVCDCVEFSDEISKKVWTLAKNVNLASGGNEDTTSKNAADKAKSDFYSRIDSPFRKWLCTIDPETDNAYDKKVKWREECVKIALEFGKNIINNVEPSAVFGKNKPIKNKPIKNKPIDKEEKKIYSAAKAMNIFVAQVKSAEIK